MLACVACSMLWMNNWQVQSFCALDSHRDADKTVELVPPKSILLISFKLPIHDFHEQSTCNSFRHYTVHCKYSYFRHRCNNFRGRTTTKTGIFTYVRISLRTSVGNLPSQNIPFFQNADSRFLMNTVIRSILTLFTNCKHRHHPNFRVANFLIFSKRLWPWDFAPMKHNL